MSKILPISGDAQNHNSNGIDTVNNVKINVNDNGKDTVKKPVRLKDVKPINEVNLIKDLETLQSDASANETKTALLKQLYQNEIVFDIQDIAKKPVISYLGNCLVEPGGTVVISGKAKAGKSTLLQGILASVLNRNTMQDPMDVEHGKIDTYGFNTHLEPDKKVLYIDTEQSTKSINRMLYGILSKAKISPENLSNSRLSEHIPLHTFSFLGYSINDKIELLQALIETNEYGLVVLDNSTDFLNSVNNEEDCNMFSENLNKWLRETNTTLIEIIHKNQKQTSGNGARGHYGSIRERRCEAQINLDKVDGIIKLTFDNTRHCYINGYSELQFDSSGVLRWYSIQDGNKPTKKDEAAKTTPDEWKALLITAFGNDKELSKNAICERIANITGNKYGTKSTLISKENVFDTKIKEYLNSNGKASRASLYSIK